MCLGKNWLGEGYFRQVYGSVDKVVGPCLLEGRTAIWKSRLALLTTYQKN